ncbi:MAG: lysophospholipid acyltransferase family protein [Clostridia bacterium]
MRYMPWFQNVAKVVVSTLYKIIYRIEITGREHIPEGGCLVCGNHPGANDPLFVLTALGYKYEMSSMGKKELYDKKWLAPILIALGTFPVDRGNTDIKAIKQCFRDIKDGKKFILFPEGTRTKNSGKKAKAGVGLIAIKMGCPILPVYIDGSPKFFGKVKVTFGPCIIPPSRTEKVDNEVYSQYVLDTIFAMGETQ